MNSRDARSCADIALCLGRRDTTIIPPCKTVDNTVDGKIQIVLVHDETLSPAPAERQNPVGVVLMPERLREPHREFT